MPKVSKKLLSERRYKKNVFRIKIVALVVMIVPSAIMIPTLVIPSALRTSEINKEIKTDKQLDLELAQVESKYTSKLGDDVWFDDKIAINAEKSVIRKENLYLGSEKNDLSVPLIIGSIFSVFTFLMGIMIMSLAYRRNIAAFGAQGIMPVANEGIEKMAPSIGKVAKEVGKGLRNKK
jgi:hypothetical protein